MLPLIEAFPSQPCGCKRTKSWVSFKAKVKCGGAESIWNGVSGLHGGQSLDT